MYPNPQEALPLPQPSTLAQSEQLATALVTACRSGDPAAIGDWATRWMDTVGPKFKSLAREIEQFARTQMSRDSGETSCGLADAQLVIARAHGFLDWPAFVTHIESLAQPGSPIAAFESAIDAIVGGSADTLKRLLHEHPDLVRARSTREHRATLLHYVSANGVEGYRQVSPKNIAEIAEILLAAGAEVDAEAAVYDGACTALGLVATSAPPAIAGVQRAVIDVLLAHGARMDRPGTAGHRHTLVRACLANGQPEAAAYLVRRGAPLDLAGAAGLGRVDALHDLARGNADLTAAATREEALDAFSLACAYGRAAAVELLLDRGVDANAELKGHGERHTGLHVAALYGHAEVVKTLVRRGARLDTIDETWRTPPLVWALTGWSRRMGGERAKFYDVVSQLVAAGATVKPDLLEWDKARADPLMLAALSGKPIADR